MIKRIVPLGFAFAILLSYAPNLFANHCYGCKIRPEPHTEPPSCVRRLNFGFQVCTPDVELDTCETSLPCGSHSASVAPLASEFAVASVERLDEPKAAESATLVATR
jgi:hypothetical protein